MYTVGYKGEMAGGILGTLGLNLLDLELGILGLNLRDRVGGWMNTADTGAESVGYIWWTTGVILGALGLNLLGISG